MQLSGDPLDLFIARRFWQLFPGREGVVRDTRPGPGDGLIERLPIGAGADLFAIVRHDFLVRFLRQAPARGGP
jgi:hypothetical protein